MALRTACLERALARAGEGAADGSVGGEAVLVGFLEEGGECECVALRLGGGEELGGEGVGLRGGGSHGWMWCDSKRARAAGL